MDIELPGEGQRIFEASGNYSWYQSSETVMNSAVSKSVTYVCNIAMQKLNA